MSEFNSLDSSLITVIVHHVCGLDCNSQETILAHISLSLKHSTNRESIIVKKTKTNKQQYALIFTCQCHMLGSLTSKIIFLQFCVVTKNASEMKS